MNLEEALRIVGEGRLEDDRQATVHLAETLWEQAIEGNMRAAKMILEYAIGRPKMSPATTEDRAEIADALRDAIGMVYGGEEEDPFDWGKDDVSND